MAWWGEICSKTRGWWADGRPSRQVYYVRGGTVNIPRGDYKAIFAYGISEVGFIELRPKPIPFSVKDGLFSNDGLEWAADISISVVAIDNPSALVKIPLEHDAIREAIEHAIAGELADALSLLTYQEVQMLSVKFGGKIAPNTTRTLQGKVPYGVEAIALRKLSPKDQRAYDALEERRRSQIIGEGFRAAQKGKVAAEESDQEIARLRATYDREMAEAAASHARNIERQDAEHRQELQKKKVKQDAEMAMLACRNEALVLVINARAQALAAGRQQYGELKYRQLKMKADYEASLQASTLPLDVRNSLLLGKDGAIEVHKIEASIAIAKANNDWKQVQEIVQLSIKGASFGGKMEAYESMLKSRGVLPTEQTTKIEISGAPAADVPSEPYITPTEKPVDGQE